jgi:hypothetical protein
MTVTKPGRALGVLAASLALATGVAACGSGSSADDEDQVKDRVQTLYTGFAEKKPDQICDSLTDKQKDTITKRPGASGKKQSCEEVMKLVLGLAGNQLKDVGKSKVSDVKVDGEKATATVSFRGRKGKVGLAKEDGDWLISDFNAGKL